MKYYLIAGEASGDLHASEFDGSLLKENDPKAEFRFLGGDLIRRAVEEPLSNVTGNGVARLYPGIAELAHHLKNNMKTCQEDIRRYQPDVVIFN